MKLPAEDGTKTVAVPEAQVTFDAGTAFGVSEPRSSPAATEMTPLTCERSTDSPRRLGMGRDRMSYNEFRSDSIAAIVSINVSNVG